ncbi:class I SAM-dependent methyltransferase [uncultured Mucilaginibacter sp.]|uniref:class I SAM-dependent methyltransferase n=1 Tax=uncultured Mucilaginibacter sp. TaxID=797541 RepID=UPI0025FD8FB9|nr:class I SAM-dependent methyltransferase [uncultured Mucilaginibacter sp.]
MAVGYDNASWFYEKLSKLVFGQAQIRAQEYFLSQISSDAHILIIGGGTGQILESLTKVHPSGLSIAYVEISPKMMALSRKRNTGKNIVEYYTEDISQISFNQKFEVIITAFVFDNFTDENVAKLLPQVSRWCKPHCIWLDTDFQLTGARWQKLMLYSMYTFFRTIGAVNVNQLPDVQNVFDVCNYQLTDEKEFYGRFIYSRVYKRSF